MRVEVIHEDGDREGWVDDLFTEVQECVRTGTLRYQGVIVKKRQDDFDEIHRKLSEAVETGERLVTPRPQRPTFTPVQWQDGTEFDLAAEQLYIEWEMRVRGDGCWRPWSDLDQRDREKWHRMANAVVRGINMNRMRTL